MDFLNETLMRITLFVFISRASQKSRRLKVQTENESVQCLPRCKNLSIYYMNAQLGLFDRGGLYLALDAFLF